MGRTTTLLHGGILAVAKWTGRRFLQILLPVIIAMLSISILELGRRECRKLCPSCHAVHTLHISAPSPNALRLRGRDLDRISRDHRDL